MKYSKRSSFVMFFVVVMIISWSITASTGTIFEEDIPPAYYHYCPLDPGLKQGGSYGAEDRTITIE